MRYTIIRRRRSVLPSRRNNTDKTKKGTIQNLNIQTQSKTGKIQKPVKVVLLYYPYIQHKSRGKTFNYFFEK